MTLYATWCYTCPKWKILCVFKKNKTFNKWAQDEGLDDSTLLKIVDEMEQGLYEANLGGSVYKKRVPIDGRGKRGGIRVIVAFKLSKITLFIYGFSKSR